MNVLLSIKPKYVDEILSGAKRYEFRRVIFRKSVETIYIYCNSSVKRIVGSFTVGGICREPQRRFGTYVINMVELQKLPFSNTLRMHPRPTLSKLGTSIDSTHRLIH